MKLEELHEGLVNHYSDRSAQLDTSSVGNYHPSVFGDASPENRAKIQATLDHIGRLLEKSGSTRVFSPCMGIPVKKD